MTQRAKLLRWGQTSNWSWDVLLSDLCSPHCKITFESCFHPRILRHFRLHFRGVSDDTTHLQIEGFDHSGIFHLFCSSHSTDIQGMVSLAQDWPSPTNSCGPLQQDFLNINYIFCPQLNRSIVDTPSTATATPATSSSSSEYRGANAAKPAARCQRKPRSLTQLHSKLSERNSEENTDLRLQRSQDQLRPLVTPGLNSLSPSCAVQEQDPPDRPLIHQHIAAHHAVHPFTPISPFLE